MLSAPTKFQDKISQGSYLDGTIIEITTGGDSILFGDITIKFPAGHIYNVINGEVTVEQDIDDLRNDWSRVVVQASLLNIAYKKDTNGDDVTLSTQLSGLTGNVANIYLVNNSEVESLSDCLKIFTGTFTRVVGYNEALLQIEMLDSGGFLFKQLATETVKNLSGAIPNDKSRLMRVPLVYGKFQTK